MIMILWDIVRTLPFRSYVVLFLTIISLKTK